MPLPYIYDQKTRDDIDARNQSIIDDAAKVLRDHNITLPPLTGGTTRQQLFGGAIRAEYMTRTISDHHIYNPRIDDIETNKPPIYAKKMRIAQRWDSAIWWIDNRGWLASPDGVVTHYHLLMPREIKHGN